MTAYPLNDTAYLAEDLRMFHAGRTPGLFNITGEDFKVKIAGGMNISVSNGLAFLKTSSDGIGGIVYSPKDETTLTATVSTNYTRYDYVPFDMIRSAIHAVLYIRKERSQCLRLFEI